VPPDVHQTGEVPRGDRTAFWFDGPKVRIPAKRTPVHATYLTLVLATKA